MLCSIVGALTRRENTSDNSVSRHIYVKICKITSNLTSNLYLQLFKKHITHHKNDKKTKIKFNDEGSPSQRSKYEFLTDFTSGFSISRVRVCSVYVLLC